MPIPKQNPQLPKPKTLKRYGLTAAEWLVMFRRQGGRCPVCKRRPPEIRLCVDHEHVPGWKKMPPDERKKYVRGLVCAFCNHQYLGRRGLTIFKVDGMLKYLVSYSNVAWELYGRIVP